MSHRQSSKKLARERAKAAKRAARAATRANRKPFGKVTIAGEKSNGLLGDSGAFPEDTVDPWPAPEIYALRQ